MKHGVQLCERFLLCRNLAWLLRCVSAVSRHLESGGARVFVCICLCSRKRQLSEFLSEAGGEGKAEGLWAPEPPMSSLNWIKEGSQGSIGGPKK